MENKEISLPEVGVDSHAHLDLSPLNEQIPQILERARRNFLKIIINVFLGPWAYYKNISLFTSHNLPIDLFFVLGVHPHEAKEVKEEDISRMEEIFKMDKKVMALGEIGLDYYRNLSPKELQLKVFKDQLKLAKELDLPVVIHSREADQDTLKILLDMGFKDKKVLWHCFTKNKEFAEKILSFGWYVSIPGVITYKNAKPLQEAVLHIDLDRILIETDCPFLTPSPFRGRTNEPSYIIYTAHKIAEIKGVELERVWEKTSKNAIFFFNL